MPTEVDERLLMFLPFYKALLIQNNPSIAPRLTDRIVREALLKALETCGHARRVRKSNGGILLEATDEYLKAAGVK